MYILKIKYQISRLSDLIINLSASFLFLLVIDVSRSVGRAVVFAGWRVLLYELSTIIRHYEAKR